MSRRIIPAPLSTKAISGAICDMATGGNFDGIKSFLEEREINDGSINIAECEDDFVVSLSSIGSQYAINKSVKDIFNLLFKKINIATMGDKCRGHLMCCLANHRALAPFITLLDAGFDPNLKSDAKNSFTTLAEQSFDRPDRLLSTLNAFDRERYEMEKEMITKIIATERLRGLTDHDLCQFVIFAINNRKDDGHTFISIRELATNLREEHGEFTIPKSFYHVFGNRERMDEILDFYREEPETKERIRTALTAQYRTYMERGAAAADVPPSSERDGAGAETLTTTKIASSLGTETKEVSDDAVSPTGLAFTEEARSKEDRDPGITPNIGCIQKFCKMIGLGRGRRNH